MITLFLAFLGALVLGAIGAWVIGKYGCRFGFLDESNGRSSHTGVVPKGGGIGILAALLFVCWVLQLPMLFWGCVGLVSIGSLYGDRKEIPPKVRLTIQFFGSVGMLFPLFHWESPVWAAYFLIPFFSVFIVGTANYYNFMDGINGIAGITGIIAFGLISLSGLLSDSHGSLFIFAGCMAFACLGFLPFNIPKARVFMGDVGSILLGFVYAGLVVGLSQSLDDFVAYCAFLFPFYADELTTEYVRLRDGENLLKPHRRHVYQLLANEIGLDHWKVSVGYGVFQLIVGVSVIFIKDYGLPIVLSMLTFYFAAFVVAGYYIRSAVAAGFQFSPRKNI